MEKLILRDLNGEYASQFLTLYDSAFPDFERRTHAALSETLKQKRFTQEIYVGNSKLLAFLSHWRFERFIFVEYIAVDPSLRGSGIGTKILGGFLSDLDGRYCVLEIEPPTDEISIKRLNFYKRFGFKQTPYTSVQTYSKNDSGHKLDILSYPHLLSDSDYADVEDAVRRVVLDPEILYV